VAFEPKDWKDGSGGGTKLNAAGLIDMEERLAGYTDDVAETVSGLLVPHSLVDAKGDLLVGLKADQVGRQPVGADGASLLADSGQATGVRYGTPRGVAIHCRFATAAELPAYSRVSNVITANENGALPAIDGVAPAVGDYVLESVGPTGSSRGVYKVTSLGSAGTKWTMERVPELDTAEEARPGLRITVAEGEVWEGSEWRLATKAPINLNTTSLSFVPVYGPKVGCSLRLTSAKTVISGTPLAIPWDDAGGTLGFNIGPCWSTTNKPRILLPFPGRWVVSPSVMFDDDPFTAGERSLFLILNGGSKNTLMQLQHSFAGRNGRALAGCKTVRMAAAGYVEACVFHDEPEPGKERTIRADEYGSGFQIGRVDVEYLGG
jgi:hypothetical protein